MILATTTFVKTLGSILFKNVATTFLSFILTGFFVGVPEAAWVAVQVGAVSGLCRVFITLLTLRGAPFNFLEFFAIPLGAIVAGMFYTHVVPLGGDIFGITTPFDVANYFLWGQYSIWIFGFVIDGIKLVKK